MHVLNLRERADRRREVEGELRRVGLSLAHPAVSLFEAVRPAERGEFPTAGTRGCFESHLAVMERIAGGAEAAGLILEDDADFTAALGPALGSLPGLRWDLLWGLYSGSGAPAAGPGWVAPEPGEALLCNHFLAVRREAAAALVPHLEAVAARPYGHPEGGAMHVDGAYNWFRRARPDLVALAAVPPVAVQRPSRTDIHALGWADRQAALRPILGLARRAKRALGAHRRG